MKRYDVITIFPEVIAPYAEASILGKAQKKKLLKIQAYDLRKFSKDKHRRVDDTPYGGGAGMVMQVEPIAEAVRTARRGGSTTRPYRGRDVRVILTSASGRKFTQADSKRLSKYDQVIFICGRYEGVDHRVEEVVADEALSIGDYVLTGGELPALVMIDAIARHLPGVLGNKESLAEESHAGELLEYPHYTKPEVYELNQTPRRRSGSASGKKLVVPSVLLSGNHAEIAKWRKQHSKKVDPSRRDGRED